MTRVARAILALASILGTLTGAVRLEAADAPRPELCAVLVATVANIDWPSKPGLPAEALRVLYPTPVPVPETPWLGKRPGK